MIYFENTPNNVGVAIYGDYKDFDGLYDALHSIVGTEEDFFSHANARLRVLAVCYDIRHALMGNREIEFVENGMDEDRMKWMSVIAPENNVYYKIYVLWPEMLFVTMVLNDFVRLYAKRNTKSKYDYMFDKKNVWDGNIAHVRLFQAEFAKCIRENVSDASYKRMMNYMNKDHTWYDDYITQYLDVLNCRYLDMNNEKRIKKLSVMAKRLSEKNEEYIQLEYDVKKAAREYNTTLDNIKPPVEYPVDFKW